MQTPLDRHQKRKKKVYKMTLRLSVCHLENKYQKKDTKYEQMRNENVKGTQLLFFFFTLNHYCFFYRQITSLQKKRNKVFFLFCFVLFSTLTRSGLVISGVRIADLLYKALLVVPEVAVAVPVVADALAVHDDNGEAVCAVLLIHGDIEGRIRQEQLLPKVPGPAGLQRRPVEPHLARTLLLPQERDLACHGVLVGAPHVGTLPVDAHRVVQPLLVVFPGEVCGAGLQCVCTAFPISMEAVYTAVLRLPIPAAVENGDALDEGQDVRLVLSVEGAGARAEALSVDLNVDWGCSQKQGSDQREHRVNGLVFFLFFQSAKRKGLGCGKDEKNRFKKKSDVLMYT